MRNKKRTRIVEETVFEAIVVGISENADPDRWVCPFCQVQTDLRYEMTQYGFDRHHNWFYVECPKCESIYELSQEVIYNG